MGITHNPAMALRIKDKGLLQGSVWELGVGGHSFATKGLEGRETYPG